MKKTIDVEQETLLLQDGQNVYLELVESDLLLLEEDEDKDLLFPDEWCLQPTNLKLID